MDERYSMIGFVVIVVLYAVIGWGLVGVLLHMRLRWRLQDSRAVTGVGPPESEMPYGPRTSTLYPSGAATERRVPAEVALGLPPGTL